MQPLLSFGGSARALLRFPTSSKLANYWSLQSGVYDKPVLLPSARQYRGVQASQHPMRTASSSHKSKDVDRNAKDDDGVEPDKDKSNPRPWHRDGAQQSPTARPRSRSALTKGKLLTTPSKLLKLILPLATVDQKLERENVAPLALLVHPQQPLSYLERLIQVELPSIKSQQGGGNKAPDIIFRAMESDENDIRPTEEDHDDGSDEETSTNQGGLGEGGVESYSGAGREANGEDTGRFVRWSSSTEIGDFVRDAARAKEFIVEIEGGPAEIRVAVPSFNDRTYYMRQRLRQISGRLANMSGVKKECDIAAHQAGQRLAMAGFGVMAGYWYLVYRLTFKTELGWDTMEPVTYLIGLSVLMGGYLWFLYHNREVSYRAALNLTISRRQNKLYEARGFNVERWQSLVEDANTLRREIKAVAAEYTVEWDEKADQHSEEVSRVLWKEEKKGDKKKKNNRPVETDDED